MSIRGLMRRRTFRTAALTLASLICHAAAVDPEEVEPADTPVAVAVALTLFASISFMMLLMYLVNHKDDDIRRYTYQTLNTTVSIFCAVLIFQSCNDIIKFHFFGYQTLQLIFAFFVMCVWFALLQFILAYLLKIVGSFPEEGTTLEVSHVDFVQLKLDTKCFVVLFSHMAGFAAINFWTNFQAWIYPLTCSSVALTFFGMKVLTEFATVFRSRVTLNDGTKDDFEIAWEKATAESEDDVVSLALSFVMCQAMREAISGHLPNAEGKEVDEVLFNHPFSEALKLWLSGIGCLVVSATLFYLQVKAHERRVRHREAQKEAEEAAHRAKSSYIYRFAGHVANAVWDLVPSGDDDEDSDEEDVDHGEGLWRSVSIIVEATSMASAWCSYYSWSWFVGHCHINDRTILGVLMALSLSVIGFGVIFHLDCIADKMEEHNRSVEGLKVVKMVIKSVGLTLGFSWEQCFDEAVNTLAVVSPMPRMTELSLAPFCAILLIPAWRWYLLPMVEEKGWKHGFVIHHHWEDHRLQKLKTHIEKKEKERTTGKTHVRIVQAHEGTMGSMINALLTPRSTPPASPRSTAWDTPRNTPRDTPRHTPRKVPRLSLSKVFDGNGHGHVETSYQRF